MRMFSSSTWATQLNLEFQIRVLLLFISKLRNCFEILILKISGKCILPTTQRLEEDGCLHTNSTSNQGNQGKTKDDIYILRLKKNLISIDKLDSTDHTIKFGKSLCATVWVSRDTKLESYIPLHSVQMWLLLLAVLPIQVYGTINLDI